MWILFWMTYKQAKFATFVSIVGALTRYGGVMCFGYGVIPAGLICLAVGIGLHFCAEAIAKAKAKKLVAKAGGAPVQTPPPAAKPAPAKPAPAPAPAKAAPAPAPAPTKATPPPAPAAPNKIKCAQCGALIAAGNKFCTQCGGDPVKPRVKTCLRCGHPLEADSKFCGECGYQAK